MAALSRHVGIFSSRIRGFGIPGNFGNCLGDSLRLVSQCQISLGHYSDQVIVCVDDWNAPDLMFLH
jgi:hypothetical protein